jgi:putative hydrolase of the HAD superfamily
MPVWIFDLDDTLHDASAHIFPVMNRAMTQYIQDQLELEEQDAHQLRQHYWTVYGATLKGLMRHHGINPHHFLQTTHQFQDLHKMVVQTKGLRHLIKNLPGRKVIFTNAPQNYAMRVLNLLNIGDIFDFIFSVESTKFHAKPSERGFQGLLKKMSVNAKDCIMLEDNLAALMTAKRLGMKTIWVSRKLNKPNFVDFRVSSVSALTHLRYNQ